MPALANIVINDYAAVAHTFSPSGPSKNNMFTFADRVGGIAIGYPVIKFGMMEPAPNAMVSNANRIFRLPISIAVPTMETTSPTTGTGIQPAPTVAYVNRCNMEFLMPERGLLANRRDLRSYVQNLLANATFLTAAIETFEGPY